MSDKNGTPSFEEQVNDVITNTTKGDDGKLVIPEGTSDAMAFAARSEMRRRDTQSAYTKSQQQVKVLEAENGKLATSWESDAVSNLSNTEQAKLEELKTQDPDAWRSEIAKIEDGKRTEFQEKREAISKEASQVTELERRTSQLEAFNKANPEIQITDDLIANDIPPRMTKDLENGVVTFDEFLGSVKEYMGKGKAVAPGAQAPNEPDFNSSRGSNKPSQDAIEAQNSSDYNKEIF